jgi:uroporphyrinogen-III synthase
VRILVTRPLPEAERTAAALTGLGHTALIAPMLVIAPVDAVFDDGRYRGVVMTSGNAARALASHPAHKDLLALPLFAVGHRTARAAQEIGFASVRSADGDGADLARLIASANVTGPLLYLAGNDRARDLPAELAVHGIHADTVIIYRADAATDFPDAVRGALAQGGVDGVLHFSRRTAAVFCDCADASGLLPAIRSVAHYCLSPRVADPLAGAGVKNVQIAPNPDENALLNLLLRS